MADPKIPLSDLPVATPGPLDRVAGVDSATGAARLFPLPQAGVPKAYETRASLPSASGLTAGTAAWVTNDPNPLLNGTWSVQGGAWVQSADRVTGLEARATSLEARVAAAAITNTPQAYDINLDTDSGLLRVANNRLRVYHGRTSFLAPGQDVPLPTTRQRAAVNTQTGVIYFTSSTSLPNTDAVIGWYDPDSQSLSGFPPYLVNGAAAIVPDFGRITVTTPSNINFDMADRRLKVSSARITTATRSYAPVAANIEFPGSSLVLYRLEYDPKDGSVVFVLSTTVAPSRSRVVFGWVRIRSASVDVFGIDEYVGAGAGEADSPEGAAYEGVLVATVTASAINFDWSANLLRVAGNAVRALYGNNNPIVPAQDMELPTTVLGRWYKILYNTETGLLSSVAAPSASPAGNILIGLMYPQTGLVYGIPDYYVNGEPRPAADLVDLDKAEPIIVVGPTTPEFELASDLPDFKAHGTSSDHEDVYALYDALVTAHPDYISRTLLGLDAAGNSIYRYDFKPPNPPTNGSLIKMILVSSMHGYERAGIYCLYSALKQVAENWSNDPHLETLRWNCHFIVVPVVVPTGFDTAERKNANGVDIARNFPVLWDQANSDPDSFQYRGPSPLSELEAQYVDQIMSENTDAIYFGSFHNFGSASGNRFIWNASPSKFSIRLAQALVSKLTRVWKRRYSWLPQDNIEYLGYSDPGAPYGSEGRHSTVTYGIQGSVFEVRNNVPLSPDTDMYSSHVATMGTEAVVNWLLMNLGHASDLYNRRQ